MSESKEQFEISVAQYGHPLLKGARHWSILIHQEPLSSAWSGIVDVYQVVGSTETYEYDTKHSVDLNRDRSYMGRVVLGSIQKSSLASVDGILKKVPITRGDLKYNCQNWVIDGLKALAAKQVDVQQPSLEDLAKMFESPIP